MLVVWAQAAIRRHMPVEEAAPAPQVERHSSPSSAEGADIVLRLGQTGPGGVQPTPAIERTPVKERKRKGAEENEGEAKTPKHEGKGVLHLVISRWSDSRHHGQQHH